MSEGSKSVVKVIRCIVCPTGCEIRAMKDKEGDISFEGYTCKRGLEYAKQEFYEPKRVLTTTIRVKNGLLPLVPVRTDKAIPKEKLRNVLNEIALKEIEAPIKMGDILLENVLNLEANVIASRNMIKIEE
ncbi:MAG: DUF1667 domain-containing protein [Candidatus Lokiarchaeota archaeon]|nr:DUF1667 domain-containing protein [Candidatus Lokiarchaeota archaeon]MBD3342637.1 DUF1667 domain-containing protein [Candidatus Lokiarchaeota archaeon]